MADEGRQGELFEEFKDVKESGLRQFARKIMSGHRHFTIMLPLENAIIISIVVTLGFIMSYALGVEMGKRTAIGKEGVSAARPIGPPPGEGIAVEIEPEAKEGLAPAAGNAELAKEEKELEAPIGRERSLLYTIQLITYKSKGLAEKQIALLRKRGYDAFIIRKGPMHQVCAGKYADKETALNDMAIFREEFKDCFLRRR